MTRIEARNNGNEKKKSVKKKGMGYLMLVSFARASCPDHRGHCISYRGQNTMVVVNGKRLLASPSSQMQLVLDIFPYAFRDPTPYA